MDAKCKKAALCGCGLLENWLNSVLQRRRRTWRNPSSSRERRRMAWRRWVRELIMERGNTCEGQGLSSRRFAKHPPGVHPSGPMASSWHAVMRERVGDAGIDRLRRRDVALRAVGVTLPAFRKSAAVERAIRTA